MLTRAFLAGEFEPVPAGVRAAARAEFLAFRRAQIAAAGLVPRENPGAANLARVGARVKAALGRLRVRIAPSPAGFAFAGVRGGESPGRALLEGDEHRIELEWRVEGAAWALRGRVLAGQSVQAQRGAPPRLSLEFEDGRARRVPVGPRGFFGPVAASSPNVRLTLATAERSLRSPWLPRAPRAPRRSRG